MSKVILVAGGKGGTGKSTVSMGVIDTALKLNEKILYVETDTENPDVQKACKDIIPTATCTLDDEGGIIALGNTVEDHFKKYDILLINAASRADVTKAAPMLEKFTDAFKMEFAILWVINRQKDCLLSLGNCLAEIKKKDNVHVVINTAWGVRDKFSIWDNSAIKKEITTPEIIYPELLDDVMDVLVNNRLLYHEAVDETIKHLRFMERATVESYRKALFEALSPVVSVAPPAKKQARGVKAHE